MIAYKVKGYTILELIITMLIAAIVIGITYYAYSIVSKSYLLFNKKNNDMAVLVRLDELMRKDFFNGSTILKDQEGITIQFKDRLIKYSFIPDAIVRTGLKIDTFKVKNEVVKSSFKDQALSDVSPVSEQNRLDEFAFNIVFQDEKISYHYYKQYSSEDLINKDQHALN